jgi:hypothetical protein
MLGLMLSMLGIILVLAAWPSHLCVAVGGMSAERRTITSGCWHDPQSGYYLYKSMDCDGAHTHITLTKDRRMVAESGYEVARFGRKPDDAAGAKIEERKLDLSTLNGIRIGMSRDEVVRKLGPPTRTAVRGQEKEYWCALYKKVAMEDRVTGRVLRNTYIFKHGKLIELSINLDAIPGCGDDDSASNEGWPWSKF